MKQRLDKLIVERGLVQSRERAQALVLAGRVLVNEQKVDKPGTTVADDAKIRLLGEDLRYVSRGGLKLERALEHWQVDVNGASCLDVGASTGGFTDCLLQHGAARVIAIDTGYGQIDMKLRNDPRVTLLEKTNARYLKSEDLAMLTESPRLLAMDVSFISATLVLPAVIAAAQPQAVVVLVKPQFEVGREKVGKGGIVRDEAAQLEAVAKVREALTKLRYEVIEAIESPILGTEGNREFLLYATRTSHIHSERTGRFCTMQHTLMKSVAIISKPEKPELSKIVPDLVSWLEQHGYKVHLDRESAAYHSNNAEVVEREQMSACCPDFAIVLGGDGTLLSAARALAPMNVPLLGVNLGSLGFLTEVPLPDLYPALEGVIANKCEVEVRSMIHAGVFRDGHQLADAHALNDVVISKTTIARLASFDIFINGSFVSSYRGDGLIVSTPTGSTAYNLAAGGPILMPAIEGIVITPICPHSLSHRPLVVRDSVEIEIKVKSATDEAFLSIDGQVGVPIAEGDRLVCRKSPYTTQLMRLQKSFFEVLRTKLKWGQKS